MIFWYPGVSNSNFCQNPKNSDIFASSCYTSTILYRIDQGVIRTYWQRDKRHNSWFPSKHDSIIQYTAFNAENVPEILNKIIQTPHWSKSIYYASTDEYGGILKYSCIL